MAEDAPCDIRQADFTLGDRSAFLGRLKETAAGTGTVIICFNADIMAGRGHVESALFHAMRSFREGDPISNSVEMEALLYACGSRQCSVSAELGIHPGSNRCYVAICPPNPDAARILGECMEWTTDDWETISAEKRARLMEIYAITPDELAVVGEDRFSELVLERVALLEVYR